ncbi:MAG: tetratricopeptide repeat protein [Phycisphaerae bacterium]|nr:tetratricopeptide repeat protein [Phycisphaerae bacterium]
MTTRMNAHAAWCLLIAPSLALAQVKSEQPRPMSNLGGVRPTLPQVHLGPPNRYPSTIGGAVTITRSPRVFIPGPTRPTIISTPAFERPLVPVTPRTIVQVPSAGLTLDGLYTDDRFRLGIHIGSSPVVLVPSLRASHFGSHSFVGGSWCDSGYASTPVIQGAYYPMYADPNLSEVVTRPAEPPAPQTRAEQGALLLRKGDARGALAEYAAHLKERPDDTEAMRGMSLALLDEGRLDDAIAVLARAYRDDPSLADRPVARSTFAGGSKRLRDVLLRVSAHANKINTGAAWHALAVLMQAEGRDRNAAAMVQRAKGLGFDESVVARMESAVGK